MNCYTDIEDCLRLYIFIVKLFLIRYFQLRASFSLAVFWFPYSLVLEYLAIRIIGFYIIEIIQLLITIS